jgi:HEAT repeat protein
MSVLGKLATSLNRRDEVPNQKLALQIVEKGDKKAVKELVENLTNADKNIQGDCIKVLYEVGERKPKLIVEHGEKFVELLASKNNRLVWGTMTALDTIALENPRLVHSALPRIVDVGNRGSVITRDHAVSILVKLTSTRKYGDAPFDLLLQQLRDCPTNQLPMYAEMAMNVIDAKDKAAFIETLSSRLDDIEKVSKRRRVEKVIKKVS